MAVARQLSSGDVQNGRQVETIAKHLSGKETMTSKTGSGM
jgi:hypothetical protein